MATGKNTPNTSEEQDEAYNPGEARYNDEFNRQSKAQELSDLERGQHVDSHGDVVNNNYNADEPDKHIQDAKDKEAAGDSFYNNKKGGSGGKMSGSLLGKRAKKYGPSGGIIGLMIGLVGMGSVALVPASLLIMMERTLTNNGTHDTRANSSMSEGRLGSIFSTGKDAICATTKIKCKVASMSKTEKERWGKQKNVKLTEGKSYFGRSTITKMEITTPENRTITINNSKEFKSAIKNDPYVKSMYYRLHSPRATFFIGPQSKFKSLLKKYKLPGGKVFSEGKAGESKEDREKRMGKEIDSKSGVPDGDTPEARSESRISKAKDKVSSISGKFESSVGGKLTKAIGSAGGWVSIGCTLYSLQKATLTGIKLTYYIDLIKFFYPFMVAAGQLIQEGDADPELMEYIGDRLTWYQQESTADTPEKKEKVGLTATDSQGFQSALYGDFSALKDFTKHYTPWWALAAATGTGALNTFVSAVGGAGNVHKACTTAKYASYAGYASPSGLGFLALCSVVNFVADDACNKAFLKILQEIVDLTLQGVYDEMKNFKPDSNLKGVDLGNAIAAGIGLFLMEKDRGSGLKPAKSTQEVKSFLSATDDSYNNYIASEKEDAKQNPLDTSNQYSFASSLATAFSQYKPQQSTIFSMAANAVSVMGTAFKPTTASAGYFEPIESVDNEQSLQSMTPDGNPGQGRTCQDEDMTNIGVLCDWTGRSVDVADPVTMEWANQMSNGDTTPWENTVDYMVDNGYIDKDSGEPVDYSEYQEPSDVEGDYEEKTYDNQYLMYKAYCTNDRVYPLGTTTVPVDDDNASQENMGWFTGSKCAGNKADGTPIGSDFDEMLNRFFFYYNMCETQIGIADQNQKCWEDDPVEDESSDTSSSSQQDSNQGCDSGDLSGDAKALAKKILECKNIQFQLDANKADIQAIADTGKDTCDQKEADTELFKEILFGANKFKITLGASSASHGCDSGPHGHRGMAIDITGIQPKEKDFQHMFGASSWQASDEPNIKAFQEYVGSYAKPGRLEFGQGTSQCWHTTTPPQLPGQAKGGQFSDACNHVHMDSTNYWITMQWPAGVTP